MPRVPATNRQRLRGAGELSASFKVFGTATEYVRAGDQGARFIFRFCPVCGTTDTLLRLTQQRVEARLSP
jgi:hypothetical protein